MKVVLAAIDAGGGGRAATVRAFFATHDRDSVLGRYSIDGSGDTTLSTYGVYRVEHGELVFDRASIRASRLRPDASQWRWPLCPCPWASLLWPCFACPKRLPNTPLRSLT